MVVGVDLWSSRERPQRHGQGDEEDREGDEPRAPGPGEPAGRSQRRGEDPRRHGDERVQDEPSQGLAGRAAQAVQEDDGHRNEQEKGRAGEGAAHGAERIGNGPDELGASRCDARRRPEEAGEECDDLGQLVPEVIGEG